MKTSQNNSRLGLCIVAIAMAALLAGAVGAQGNGQPVQTGEGPAMNPMTMMMNAGDMPIQNITEAV